MNIINLGGGVQSTVLALMIAKGYWGSRADAGSIVPDHGIFANTGWEAPETLEMIHYLTG